MSVVAQKASSVKGEQKEAWKTATIGEVAVKVGSGITPTGGEKVYRKSGRPFVRSQNVGWGSLNLSDVAYIDEETHEAFASTEIDDEDVFLNITGASIGRSACADKRVVGGNVNQHVCIIRPDKNRLSSKFLNYLLISRIGQDQIDSYQAGGNRQGLNFAQVKSIELPLPSLVEQRAIAETLVEVDSLIESLKRLIAKKRDIKQATAQQLFSRKVRLAGFTGDWSVKLLGEIATIKDGTHQTPKYVDSGVPFYSVEQVTSGDFDHTKFISEAEHQFLTKSSKIERGDILMTRIGSIGDCKLVDWDVRASFYVSLALLKVAKGTSAAYLAHYSETATFRSEADLHSLQSAIPKKINLGPISNIRIELPIFAEQTAIADVLADMDSELTLLDERLSKTFDIKLGIMQQLLTGQVRLI